MSFGFRDILQKYSNYKKENREQRISDAFRIGEKLLLSTDNIRPKSRQKSPIINDTKFVKRHVCAPTVKIKNQHVTGQRDLKRVSDVFCQESYKELINESTFEDVHEKTGKNLRTKENSPVKSIKCKHDQVFEQLDKRSSACTASNTPSTKPIGMDSPCKKSLSYIGPIKCIVDQQTNIVYPQNNAPEISNNPLQKLAYSACNSNTKFNNSRVYALRNRSNTVANMVTTNHRVVAQKVPLVVLKLDEYAKFKTEDNCIVNEVAKIYTAEQLSLDAGSCNLQETSKRSVKAMNKCQPKCLHSLLSSVISHEDVSTSIYGGNYSTAGKITDQAESEKVKKFKKIFLSGKQFGILSEYGLELPCAPSPDGLRKYEHIPSLSDIQSQKEVKSRFTVIQKKHSKKQVKEKVLQATLEKKQLKEKERQLKAKQRKEIYALNKVMTELENKRFHEFCYSKSF